MFLLSQKLELKGFQMKSAVDFPKEITFLSQNEEKWKEKKNEQKYRENLGDNILVLFFNVLVQVWFDISRTVLFIVSSGRSNLTYEFPVDYRTT